MKNIFLNFEFWNRHRIFWLLNVTGWFVLFVLVFGMLRDKIEDFGGFFRLASFYVSGFIITSLLRIRLKRIVWRNRSIFKLLGLVLTVSTVSAMVVYVIHVAVSIPTLDLDLKNDAAPLKIIWDIFQQYIFTWHTIIIFMALFLWMVLYFGLKFFIDLSKESERAEQALIQAQKAQLEMLRYQLNPHFLFNSLNSIWALVDEDPSATKSMINELSDFLRYSLLFDNKPFKPLGHEVEALKNYFSIEMKRFQDKLKVDFDIDPATTQIPVLSFFMQPFVENAIKFGMKTSPMPLRISITTKKILEGLIIRISNTGSWIEPDIQVEEDMFYTGTGMGLENIRKRMEIAYPGNHTVLTSFEDDAVKIEIRIPVEII
ncbi:MAG: histidine kinase [Bacteroidetes bacterium]|jgi:two-component system, LytTR family, sensor kinase|nr:histidine kinase [Bacteroidota bacterium]MBT4397880.1 histidine kinase [Bacteroidota bacterium]MBT4411123.1 histidine kinase [Bacteroidota bacterium]MBT5427726.1 histidine kinase [Bacteroidota bacterium]MBT7463334.1 histidine kinase [Bacteroidota bacterium]